MLSKALENKGDAKQSLPWGRTYMRPASVTLRARPKDTLGQSSRYRTVYLQPLKCGSLIGCCYECVVYRYQNALFIGMLQVNM